MTTHQGEVFTVVWEGFFAGGSTANLYTTVVRPGEYGYSQSPTTDELAIMAVAEQHDGEDPYETVNVMFVYYGDNKPIAIEDNDDEGSS